MNQRREIGKYILNMLELIYTERQCQTKQRARKTESDCTLWSQKADTHLKQNVTPRSKILQQIKVTIWIIIKLRQESKILPKY